MTNDSVEAVIEDLRLWDPMFYSDSETKLIMKLAADYLDQYVVRMVTCDSCGLIHPKTDGKCPRCGAANV